MTIISKEERSYLESKGFKMGQDIFKTYSKHPKYYLVTSPRAVKLLNKFRDNSTVLTVEKPNYCKVTRTEKG